MFLKKHNPGVNPWDCNAVYSILFQAATAT